MQFGRFIPLTPFRKWMWRRICLFDCLLGSLIQSDLFKCLFRNCEIGLNNLFKSKVKWLQPAWNSFDVQFLYFRWDSRGFWSCASFQGLFDFQIFSEMSEDILALVFSLNVFWMLFEYCWNFYLRLWQFFLLEFA